MTVNLATIPEPHARAFIAGYGEGYGHGIARALADVEAADDATWAGCPGPSAPRHAVHGFHSSATGAGNL